MSVEIDNIKGVFTDLDDGGLDEREALAQIRGLVGAPHKVRRVLITYLVPIDLTIDLDRETVEKAEQDMSTVWGPAPQAYVQDADTQKDLPPGADTDRIIEAAREIADDAGWLYEVIQV